MKKLFTFLAFTLFITALFPKSTIADDGFGLKLKGYVKTDFFYDTRMNNFAPRQGHFNLFPSKEILVDDEDVNEGINFNILSIQTRLAGTISAPDALGAKTSGYFEAEFFGHTGADINGFRLRHAFVKLDWGNTIFMAGQYWHPLFVTDCYAGTVNFSTGAPFQAFSRNPQLRLIQKFGKNVQLTLAAVSQRDFSDVGSGEAGIRNAGVPELHGQLQINAGPHAFGVGAGYKMIKPVTRFTREYEVVEPDTTYTEKVDFKVDEILGSMSTVAFAKMVFGDFSVKVEGVYGENLSNMMMMGGWAKVNADDAIFTADDIKYTSYKTMSVWGDLAYGKDLQFGLFGAYMKNLGTNDNYSGEAYGWASSDKVTVNVLEIADMIRIAPRVVVNYGKFRFAAEYEMTGANYGIIDTEDKGAVNDAEMVVNHRVLFGFYVFF